MRAKNNFHFIVPIACVLGCGHATATPTGGAISLSDRLAQIRAPYLKLVEQVASRVREGSVQTRSGEIMKFRRFTDATYYARTTLNKEIIPGIEKATEKGAYPWWLIGKSDVEPLFIFNIRIENKVHPRIEGLVYEIKNTGCDGDQNEYQDLFLLVVLDPPLELGQEVVFSDELLIPTDHALARSNNHVCGTVVGVF